MRESRRRELAAIIVFLVVRWPFLVFARWWDRSDRGARGALLLLLGLWMAVVVVKNLDANERQLALARVMSPEGVAATDAARAEFLRYDLAKSGHELGALRVRPAPTQTGNEPLFRVLKLIQGGMDPGRASESVYGSGAPLVFAFSSPLLGEPHISSYDPAVIGSPPDHPCAQKWWPEIVAAGQKHGVDPRLILEFMGNESACKKGALSPVGAQGLMQIMPTTGQEIQNQCRENAAAVWEPGVNISLGACYIRMMADALTGGDLSTWDSVFWVAAAYNCGPGCAGQTMRGQRSLPAETVPYARAIASAYTGAR